MAEPVLSKEQAEKILAKNNTNAVRRAIEKALKNQPLTRKEQQLMEQIAGQEAAGSGEGEWVSSYEALGKLVGLHRASFPRIVKQHRDAPRARANGEHHVPSWKHFLAQHPEIDCRSQAPTSTKEEIDQEKLRRIRFQNDREEKAYIGVSESARTVRDIGEQLKTTLRTTLEDELPPVLEGLSAASIRVHMKELNDRLCRLFQEGIGALARVDEKGRKGEREKGGESF